MSPTGIIEVPVSFGELLDKISILELKQSRISDAGQVRNVTTELELLRQRFDQHAASAVDVASLRSELAVVNGQLWDIEDAIRAKERAREFDAEFVELARSVYRTNDQRAALKRALNLALGSALVEEKSYHQY